MKCNGKNLKQWASNRKLGEKYGKRLDDMRQMVEEKLQKTLNERIGQSFEIVRSQLENVQKGLGENGGLHEE